MACLPEEIFNLTASASVERERRVLVPYLYTLDLGLIDPVTPNRGILWVCAAEHFANKTLAPPPTCYTTVTAKGRT
jgi:hypothetical protein